MKKIYTIFFLFIIIPSFAQKGIFVGINVTPNYSFRHYTSITPSSYPSQQPNYKRYNDSKSIFQYNAGIDFGYRISPSFSVQTGIWCSRTGFSSSNIVMYYPRNFYPNGSATTIMHNIEFPLIVSFYFPSKKPSWVISAGFIFGKITNYRTIGKNVNNPEEQPATFIDPYYKKGQSYGDIYLSFGRQFKLTEKNIIAVEPLIRYRIVNTSYPDNEPSQPYLVNVQIFTIGVKISYQFYFKS